MSNIMKTPSNASITELNRVIKRYSRPANSMEAFILYGAVMAVAASDEEHARLRGVPLVEEHSNARAKEIVDEEAASEFDSVIAGQ